MFSGETRDILPATFDAKQFVSLETVTASLASTLQIRKNTSSFATPCQYALLQQCFQHRHPLTTEDVTKTAFC